jgi:hypothetical protein
VTRVDPIAWICPVLVKAGVVIVGVVLGRIQVLS